jgi:adenylate cyclase, class 2
MPTQETEAKFLNINPDKIREKLGSIGAKLLEPSTPVRRAILETPEMRDKEAFVRVRDEGGKVTVVYKQHAKLELGGAIEVALPADNIDFEGAVEYNKAILGNCSESYQETRRETWKLDKAVITLDEWPWLNPFVEVEADTGEAVKAAAKKIGFDWQEAVFGGINIVYRMQYPHLDEKATITKLPVVKFSDPLPEMLQG